MLVVGVVGWGGAPHPSRLTPDEQYSHITLWSLLAAPLLLGNDLTRLDPFTRNLLTNDEVIAVNQDPLGLAARRVHDRDGWQVWVRQLADGGKAVGIFNLDSTFRSWSLDPAALELTTGATLRDLWRQREAGTLTSGYRVSVPAHGVVLLGLSAPAESGSAEQLRPRFHFTPPRNFMNDPNGLLYYRGEYHHFYQYNPIGTVWGHMSWGHAVSRDMLRWEHLPVPLAEEDSSMIFSGSAVVASVRVGAGFGF